VTVTPVRFPALDGYVLGGFLHTGADQEPVHAVVFATGGGIRAEAYRHFLSYLASHGIAVLAFDYRGIGESRPPQLRGFVAGFEDWAEYDAGGAIAWMAARYPKASLTGMGHSIGALMIGASTTATALTQLVLIAPHTGYHGDYAFAVRWMVRFAWRVAGPSLRSAFGYFPARMLRLGEDLPARVALQWAGYVSPEMPLGIDDGDHQRERRLLDHMSSLHKRALVVSIDDDPWATENGVRRAMHAYRNLTIVRRVIQSLPGQTKLGHWDFFRRRMSGLLWPFALHFIKSPSDQGRHTSALAAEGRSYEHDAAQT